MRKQFIVAVIATVFLPLPARPETIAINMMKAALDNRYNRTPKEVWITRDRSDGKGKGTQIDPYDGSTAAKLDAILRGISTYTKVHFGPGLFETFGFQDSKTDTGFEVKEGCHYVGAARDVTTIKLMSLNVPQPVGYVFGASGGASNSSISDMTIDCNAANIAGSFGAKHKVCAAALSRDNCSIRRVHAIHAYGKQAAGLESFVLGISATGLGEPSTTEHAANGVIEDCIVDTFATGNDYAVGIAIGGISSCRISRNYVRDITSGSCAFQSYSSNVMIENNMVENCLRTFFIDTGNADHIIIRNNTIKKSRGQVIGLNASTGQLQTDYVIENNIVDFGDTSAFASAHTRARFIDADGGNNGVTVQRVHIRNNTVTSSGGYPYWPIYVQNYVGDFQLDSSNSFDKYAFWSSDGVNAIQQEFGANVQNDNSALAGSVKVTTGLDSSSNCYVLYQFQPGASYTIAAGDVLKYEVYADEANNNDGIVGFIVTTDGSEDNISIRDQNGVPQKGGANVKLFAKGKWYSRRFNLDGFAGKTTSSFKIGWLTGSVNTGLSGTGTQTAYFRNIRIVDNNGNLKYKFYAERDSTPSLAEHSNTSSYSASIVTPARTARFGTGSSTPSDNTDYDVFLNTTTHHILGWTGSAWAQLDN